MPRISLPPFLKKLQTVTTSVEDHVAHWNNSGDVFIVEKSDAFEKALAEYFKGSLLTFIRQLHFYGFRKVDIKGEKWSFSHRCFREGQPHLIYEIRRKTRTETNDGVASHAEVQALRDHVGTLHTLLKDMQADLKETKEELVILRHQVKQVEYKTDVEFDAFSAPLSNGGDMIMKGKVMKEEPAFKKQRSDTSFAGLPFKGEEDDLDSYMENFSSFLPFTDSAFESMNGSASALSPL